jgi:hypothetical protein
MVLDEDKQIFENLTEKQTGLFKKLLEDNNITYEVMHSPYYIINEIHYEAKTHKYSNFNELITDLNSQSIAEIFLYKVYVSSDSDSGELSYKIRYAINKDLINNKTIKFIKKLVGEIKSSKNVKSISTDRIKRILQKQNISEVACLNIIKLIRIFEKEFNTTHTGELNG